jgi:magnesium-transporting ATPase (P-type)
MEESFNRRIALMQTMASTSEEQEALQSLSLSALQATLGASPAGLSQVEAQRRLAQYGYDELSETTINPFLKFLTYFWGPIPGSILRQGESDALVYGTGQHTYFGKTAQLVQEAHTVSHFQRAVLNIGDYLIVLAVGLVVLILAVALFRGDAMTTTLQFALVLTVAAIPVARCATRWGDPVHRL